VHFSLLGPLQVRRGEILVPIRGTLRRTLLAALLLNRDAVVSADRLSELLWGAEAAPSASAPLYNQVMRLRRVLGEDGELIHAVAPGYLIRIEPDQLDLAEFSDLCSTARQAAASTDWLKAAELYAAALALWRGELLADLPALRAHAAVRRFE
jgi:DNA-binding SARP family transcriptional activator